MPEARLRPLSYEMLDSAQREMWDAIAAGPRAQTAVREEGHLTGPFDVLLRSPDIGLAVSELGARLRYGSSLDQYDTELVIVTVAGHWRARFAWLRHVDYAKRAGIDDAIVAEIGSGSTPNLTRERDRVIYSLVRGLLAHGRVSDQDYSRARVILGERSLVDLVVLTGYYTLSSFVLNTFDVPLPAGTHSPWDEPTERN